MKRYFKRLSVSAALLLVLGVTIISLKLTVQNFDKKGERDFSKVLIPFKNTGDNPYWQITAGAANAWMIPCDGGYLMVDTGYPSDYEVFKAGIAAAGIKLNGIRYLFITHAHDEHAGFAASLKKDTGCRLILPEKSLPGLASGKFDWQGVTVNKPIHLLGQIYNLIKKRDFSFDPVIPGSEDIILSGDRSDIARNWGVDGTFYGTPGHTADSWSLILDDGTAVVGDAAMNILSAFGAGKRPIFMEDRRQSYESIKFIKEQGAVWILSGHGDAFEADLLPEFLTEASAGPGIRDLIPFFLKLVPGFILIGILLQTAGKGNKGFRIILYIMGFILMRDLMTPFGFWSFGSDPVFWLRFAADGVLLGSLAVGSLMISSVILFLEYNQGNRLVWFKGSKVFSIASGLAGAIAATAPLLLLYTGILPGERGGVFPVPLFPVLLFLGLSGNLLEEILFRGYFQEWIIEKGVAENQAALSSGLFFGLCHVFLAYTVRDVGVSLLMFAAWEGILCGFLKNRFGLVSAVICHGLAVSILTLI